MKSITRWMIYGIIAVGLVGMGCGKEDQRAKAEAEARAKSEAEAARMKSEAEAKAKAEAAAREAQMRAEAEATAREARMFMPVYFDYDKYNIRDDQKMGLSQNMEKLTQNAGYNMALEGHCDERGTIEYNIALGQKRADSVKKYLVKAGINAGRLTTVSYGKERPMDMGHDESAWAKNRRVELAVK